MHVTKPNKTSISHTTHIELNHNNIATDSSINQNMHQDSLNPDVCFASCIFDDDIHHNNLLWYHEMTLFDLSRLLWFADHDTKLCFDLIVKPTVHLDAQRTYYQNYRSYC
eukprot:865745_1